MYNVLIIIYLLVAIALVGMILVQQGKGADMGASFGAGASGTLFGSSGSGNFLTRTTAVLAIGFFILSLAIGNLSANHVKQQDSWNSLEPTSTKVEQPVKAPEPVKESQDKIPD